MVDATAAFLDLEQAQAEQATAEEDLANYVEIASALDKQLFQRGLDKRRARVEAAHASVLTLSARVGRIPAGGSFPSLWARFDRLRRREMLVGFLDRITVDGSATGDLGGSRSPGCVASNRSSHRSRAQFRPE